MKKFTKTNLDTLRKDLNKALEAVQKKHGIDIHVGNISYKENEAKVKVICETKSAGEAKVKQENSEYDFHRKYYSELPEMNSKIKLNGKIFTITGWSSRAKKYPVIITNSKGKQFKISVEMFSNGQIEVL